MRDDKVGGEKIVVNLFHIFRKSSSARQFVNFFHGKPVYRRRGRIDIIDRKEEILCGRSAFRLHYIRKLYYSAGSKPRRFGIEKKYHFFTGIPFFTFFRGLLFREE